MKPKTDYKKLLLDPRWQKKRLQILERDGWACRCCGDKAKTLHVHHVHYHPNAEGPWDYADTSLVTLCCDCHESEGPELTTYRNFLIEQLVAAGCWKSCHFCMLGDAFSTSTPMNSQELEAFSWAIMHLTQSREAYLAKQAGKDSTVFASDEKGWLAVQRAYSTACED